MKDNSIKREAYSGPETYVYHFTTRETALEFILPSMTIRFNPAKYVNDPREAKTWDFEFGGGLEKAMDNVIMQFDASEYAKSTTMMFCCSYFQEPCLFLPTTEMSIALKISRTKGSGLSKLKSSQELNHNSGP